MKKTFTTLFLIFIISTSAFAQSYIDSIAANLGIVYDYVNFEHNLDNKTTISFPIGTYSPIIYLSQNQFESALITGVFVDKVINTNKEITTYDVRYKLGAGLQISLFTFSDLYFTPTLTFELDIPFSKQSSLYFKTSEQIFRFRHDFDDGSNGFEWVIDDFLSSTFGSLMQGLSIGYRHIY